MAEKFVPEISIKFDKQDIVTVALAKIEANIIGTVREAKAEVTAMKNKVNKLNAELPKIGAKNVPVTLVKKQIVLDKTLKALKVKKKFIAEITYDLGAEVNTYSLVVNSVTTDGRKVSTMVFVTERTPFTKVQKDIRKTITQCLTKETQAINRGVEWKAKLSDMHRAERQMRAVVVESELSKTKDGRAMVDLLTAKYMDTIKLIEM